MSIPDIRLVYMNLVAALLVFVAGILSFMSPECHVVLLAILFIVGGEAAFVTWGMDRVHHPEADQRPLKFLVYIGLSAILMAVVILFFRSYLQMYAIQFTAVLLILAFIMQCVLSYKIYRVLKKQGFIHADDCIILLPVHDVALPVLSPFLTRAPVRYHRHPEFCVHHHDPFWFFPGTQKCHTGRTVIPPL